MILFNDLSIQYQKIKNELDMTVQNVLDNGWYILGPELENFEQEFADYIGVKYCVGVGSGTDALTLSLWALNIGSGDEVITTNLTAYPTIVGIIRSGAKPVTVDIFSNDGLIDYSKIEEKITDKTRAILPVHLYGQSCDMNKILRIAKKHNLYLIEDCAQSVGTTYEGQKTGSFGHCSAFSFYPTKNLGAYGDAGAIVTNDENIFKQLKLLRNYGQSLRYKHDVIGINSRLDEIQAAILNVKLKYVDEWNESRIWAAKYYHDNLTSIESLIQHDYGVPNYHLFVIKSEKRDKLMEYLKTHSIQSFIHYPIPVNQQKAYTGLIDEEFEVSSKFAKEVLSIPIYPNMDEQTLNIIIQTINGFKN
jgi:dTDP-4-amino-4,6-dideoxygalactose transaminase